MTPFAMIFIGIALVVGTIISVTYSLTKTPDSLQGYYGAFYGIISLGGLIGGIALILFSFLP